MKYTLTINQPQAIELGISSVNQALIFDMLTSAATWAKPAIIDNDVYYWVARQTIANELKLLNLKPDTIYRHLKSLAKIGLINYKKVGKKDCIQITKKGQKYLSKDKNSTMSETNSNHYVGNKSELIQNSEIYPSKFGNKSEKNSEINPTYPTTNSNQYTNHPLLERVDFKKFKEKVVQTELQFSLPGKLGYSKEHKGFKIKNGLIFSLHTNKFVQKDEAFQIWNYLFEKQDKVFELLGKEDVRAS